MTDHPDGRSLVLRRGPDVAWRRTFDAVIAAGAGDVTTLAGPASVAWELLQTPMTRDDVAADLAALHGVATSSIVAEVDAAIDALVAAGVVVERPVTDATSTAIAPIQRPPHRELPGEPIVDDPLAACAAWRIGPQVALPDPEVVGWDALRTSIDRERLTGLVYGAYRAGELALASDELADAAAAHRSAMTATVRSERLLHEVSAVLTSAGVAPIVHKGPSIAHVEYDDPAFRPFGDIDLLVPSAALDTVYAALTDMGMRRRYAQPKAGFDRRFGKGAAFVTADGLEIDVHRTFAAGPFGLTVDLEEVHAAAGTITVEGHHIGVLAPTHQLIAVAMHAALGSRWPRLLNLRDLAELVRREDVEPDEVIATAARWRVDTAVARAVRAVSSAFHLDVRGEPLLAWAARHEPSPRQRRALDAYTASSRSYGRQAIAALPAIPGVSAKAAYLRAMLLPDRADGVDESLVRRWRRLASTAVRR